MKHCSKCNNSFEDSEYEKHLNLCKYNPSNEEYESLIPCEFCNNFINFDDYQTHIQTCNTNNLLQNIMTPLNNIFTFHNLNNFDNDTEQVFNNEENDENISDDISETNDNENANTNNLDFIHNMINIISNSGLLDNQNFNVNYNNYNEYEDNYNLSEDMGSVEPNLEANEYTKSINEDIKCPICFENTNDNRITMCGHKFCLPCIKKWIKSYNKCPICMIELKKNI